MLEKFREHVRSCCAGRSYIDRVVITSDTTGSIGKLAAVKAQIAPRLLQDTFMCEDDCTVIREWFENCQQGICSEPCGISVPRKPKFSSVWYYVNFAEALEHRLL